MQTEKIQSNAFNLSFVTFSLRLRLARLTESHRVRKRGQEHSPVVGRFENP
jgi:hypothetical protein